MPTNNDKQTSPLRTAFHAVLAINSDLQELPADHVAHEEIAKAVELLKAAQVALNQGMRKVRDAAEGKGK